MKNVGTMKLKMNYLVIAILALSIGKAWGNCPEFETALEIAMGKVTAREASKSVDTDWNTPEANAFKLKYNSEVRGVADNRKFMTLMEQDKKLGNRDVLYFDVENSVQKKLNDTIVGDKEMVDAINNSFMAKFNKNLSASPEIMKRLEGQYQDFKPIRLRLKLQSGDDRALLEKKLDEIYRKTNAEFVAEFEASGMTKLIPPRTDEVVDPSHWFLSGTGESALEANMAARGARTAGFAPGKAKTLGFKEQVDTIHADLNSIEGIRLSLVQNEALLKSGIMIKTSTGEVIPSRDMVGILRKIQMADCQSVAEYNAKIRAKVKTLFKDKISDKNIEELTAYFKKVDSISPPIFQRQRTVINLGEAKSGIVSVDFSGVGVDNAFEQMRALSAVNYAQQDKLLMIKDAFGKVQGNVDKVTDDLNMGKRAFNKASNENNSTKFSGDDGILMPNTKWEKAKKQELLRELSRTSDPSKFRVTFVRTEFESGVSIPAMERSSRVVRAESIEKNLREAVVGTTKIESSKARKMIFAIDSIPSVTGGKFNLIIGGEKPTAAELKMIEAAFKKLMDKKDGEVFGEIIEAY
jgi:hypothetical protein